MYIYKFPKKARRKLVEIKFHGHYREFSNVKD